MNIYLKKDEILIFNNTSNMIALGNIKNKKGYQKVTISIKYLKKALNYLNEFNENNVTIFVKNNNCLMIGKEKMGIIIAPVIEEESK